MCGKLYYSVSALYTITSYIDDNPQIYFKMSVDYVLYEASLGYAIFQVVIQADTIGNRLKEVQEASLDLAKFSKMVKLVSFAPFQGAAQALENANYIAEGIASDYLKSLLELNLPSGGKKSKSKLVLGVYEKNLANSIIQTFPNIDCLTADNTPTVADLLRGIKLHFGKLVGKLQSGDVERSQLGLGHAYSRGKVKFSVQKNDNHIIQAIATLDQLDKAVNTFSMRVREWYSWHFPELVRLASENYTYARLVLFIKDKKGLNDDSKTGLAELLGDDEGLAQDIISTAKASMGQDVSESDMENILAFATRVVSLTKYRRSLSAYLTSKMSAVAPNLAALIGETVAARLISHAGSLTNLSKYPASTVQILGAEKALFRALKTKGNTPKYGLIFHSSFIGRAGQKNKGRISRFLANKCSIASRIDNFSEHPSTKFGEALRNQVEERLNFYATGTAPTKNSDAMKKAMDATLMDLDIEDPEAGSDSDVEMADIAPRTVQKQERKPHDAGNDGLAADVNKMEIVDSHEVKRVKKSKKEESKRKQVGDVAGPAVVDAKGKKKSRRESVVNGNVEEKLAERREKKKHRKTA